MNRRGFLKFAAGGVTGLVASPIIWNTLYDAVYWSQNWGWIPRLQYGAEEYIPTISKLDPSGTGLRVRLIEGRPVRALGNPDNEMSQGGLTALAAAETQLLFSSARLKTPLKRSPDGALVAISWAEAEELLLTKYQEAGSSISGISGDPTSTVSEVLSGLVNAKGSGDFYFMPSDELPADKAWSAMGGQGRIGYDLENSDFVLAIGANLLESWGTVARNRKIFGQKRPVGEEPTLKLAYAGPVQNNTASTADWWLPIKPGTEMVLALGVAHLLVKTGRAGFGINVGHLADLIEEYTPEKVAALTGVAASRLTEVVAALAQAEKPLVIVGSELGAGGGAGPVMAGIAVNMLLGRLGQEGNMLGLPYPPKVVPTASEYRDSIRRDLVAYAQAVALGDVEAPKLLMLYEANPLYALPATSGARHLLERAGYKVMMATFMNETCQACDLVLPAAMGLERFDDVNTPYGSGVVNYAISHPVVQPYYQARPMGDLLLALGKAAGINLGAEDMPHLLERKAYAMHANFRTMMDTGQVFTQPTVRSFGLPYYGVDALSAALTLPESSGNAVVAPVTIMGMGTSQTGIPPFATKIITEYQLKGRYSVAQMNSATADNLGVKKGQRIRLSNNNAEIEALVDIYEGVIPNAVAMCTGLGHTAFDEFSQNKGANIVTLTAVTKEPGTGLSVWGTAGVTVTKA